jgi:signal transduction histidine kinase
MALPLCAGDRAVGLWLLGKRDPDDYYSQAEVATLSALADQMAIALTNIAQAKRLRVLYQLDIDQQETERTRLALELHDDALHRFAELKNIVAEQGHSPAFERSYQELADHLRSIVHGLHPPMLDYGLYSALQALTEDLVQRAGSVRVSLEVEPSPVRYERQLEQHVFRIVQQACKNTLRHASAAQLSITGQLAKERLKLLVSDDGQGFALDMGSDLVKLLEGRHFGLAGMSERAALIGARLDIHSQPGRGTAIAIEWNA